MTSTPWVSDSIHNVSIHDWFFFCAARLNRDYAQTKFMNKKVKVSVYLISTVIYEFHAFIARHCTIYATLEEFNSLSLARSRAGTTFFTQTLNGNALISVHYSSFWTCASFDFIVNHKLGIVNVKTIIHKTMCIRDTGNLIIKYLTF